MRNRRQFHNSVSCYKYAFVLVTRIVVVSVSTSWESFVLELSAVCVSAASTELYASLLQSVMKYARFTCMLISAVIKGLERCAVKGWFACVVYFAKSAETPGQSC